MVDLMDPQQVLARTIWGEDRSGTVPGMSAVANVIMNRVAHGGWWGNTVITVCLRPWQFSSWNPLIQGQPMNANYEAMMEAGLQTPGFQDALAIAGLAISGKLQDATDGADSYYEPASVISPPAWAEKAIFTVEIAGQRYYRTV